MKLLTRTFRGLQLFLGPDVWFSSGVLAVLAALEIVGRQHAATDGHDLIAASVLAFVALAAIYRHRQEPLGWVSSVIALGRRVGASVRRLGFEIGIDLRGSPPLPRGYPPTIVLALLFCGAWTAALVLFPEVFPLGIRLVATHVFYLGYLVALVAVWTVLLLLIVATVFLPWAMIHDALVSSSTDSERRVQRWEYLIFPAYLSALFLGYVFLPLWLPVAVCLLALAVNLATIAIPANPDVKFIWRLRLGSQVHCLSWGRWVTCEFTLLTLGLVNLVLTTWASLALLGDAAAAEAMPITTTFGQILAWLAPGAVCGIVAQTVISRWRDPARPCQPVVHIGGERAQEQRAALEQIFAGHGWQVRVAPAPPQPTDVRVELADTPADASASWPLRATLAELGLRDTIARLARRDEIQNRRRLVSGLELLFKRAARRKYKCGSGFWIAPHYWFIGGLVRDTHEEEVDFKEGTLLSGTIGPAYHRIFPRCVRHHLYLILRALQVDLIFVEDGVGFRRFCRVLRMMFELFDIYGGRRRADEIHFQGVPGMRVLIHEYVLDEPFKSELYPEPEFENLGRARLLHIFRDRGEQPERLDVPLDSTHTPVPVGAV